MPLYDFRDLKTGETIEEFFHMASVPEQVHKDGKVYDRVFYVPQARVKADRHFVSHSLPKNYKFHNRFDSQGRCAFDSQREVDECMARANDAGENLNYDY